MDNKDKVVVHYANSSLGERCFMYLLDLYISKLSPKAVEKDLFFCKPVKSILAGKPWYHDTPVGHNTLKKKLKNLFLSAGLDAENITSGVRSYEHTISQQKKDIRHIS